MDVRHVTSVPCIRNTSVRHHYPCKFRPARF
jgi:hypothetical protein